MAARQDFTIVSGDIKTIGPITCVDSAGVAVNISTILKIKLRMFARTSAGLPTGSAVLTKELPTTWLVATAYALGDFVIPTAPNNLSYEATVAGTSHATTQPTWPTTLGLTVVDQGVTWTCRNLGNQLVGGGTTGQFQFVIGLDDTAGLSGSYWYEVRLVEADADEFTVLNGIASILPDRVVT